MRYIHEEQKFHLEPFCKYLPEHVKIWLDMKENAFTVIRSMRANIQEIELVQRDLSERIDEELELRLADLDANFTIHRGQILEYVEDMFHSMIKVRSLLLNFERAYLGNGSDNPGRSIQLEPDLHDLLQRGREYLLYFMWTYSHMYWWLQNGPSLQEHVNGLEQSFIIHLTYDERVTDLLALAQYVLNNNKLNLMFQ